MPGPIRAPCYKTRLLADAPAAMTEAGLPNQYGDHMVVVENTPKVHNLVVCTLCSCYPWLVLGLPPVWYKSTAYRSRAVIDPRGILREFGTVLPDEVEIRVWTAPPGAALPRPARASGRNRKFQRRPARRAGVARCHGGRRQGIFGDELHPLRKLEDPRVGEKAALDRESDQPAARRIDADQ